MILNFINCCYYCMVGYIMMMKCVGMLDDIIEDLCEGCILVDLKLVVL